MTLPHSIRTAVAIAAAAALLSPGPLQGQDQEGIPSVGVAPADPEPGDPNGGQWFLLDITQGATGVARAQIVNPAEVSQTVRLYLLDLTFAPDGTPTMEEGDQAGIGAWGAFRNPEITIRPGQTVVAEFVIAVPADAPPGDHVGVVVAETVATGFEGADSDEGAQFEIRRRVATRVYVTVPGDATRAFEIVAVDTSLDSGLFPSTALVTVTMRNDGRVRLSPTVTIGGAAADGPDPFMSESVEEWSAFVSVPWYGGPVTIPVEAVDDSGLTRRVNATKFVIPWGLLIGLALATAVGWRIRHWWRTRGSGQAELKADIARLERLITQQAGGETEPTGVPNVEPPAGDEITGLNATVARARRADDDAALARAALALHASTDDALDVLLEALSRHDGKHVPALVDAVASYGADAIADNQRTSSLPEGLRERIGARVLVLAGSSGNGEHRGEGREAAGTGGLGDVKGLGPAKRQALMDRFDSVEAVRSASVEELAAVKGIGPKLAQDILDHLR
ncbi:MAG: hypothetical protein KY469_00275 [Actinobacteria bacterium]|nr:hypothetical protein [Actinomycetota bacterium]